MSRGLNQQPTRAAKRCNDCGETKPAADFYWKPREPDGLFSYCKACSAARARTARNRPGRKAAARERHRRERLAVLSHYGGRCACCGEAEPDFLAIDHPAGDGTAHRKSIRNAPIYRWLVKEGLPDGYRVLCHNCNCARGYYGYCPHERDEAVSGVRADESIGIVPTRQPHA